MPRSILIAIVLVTGAPLTAQASDRYGPSDSALRGAPPVLSDRALLTWAGKDAGLRQLQHQRPAAATGTRAAQSVRPALRGAVQPLIAQVPAPRVQTRPEYPAEPRPTPAPHSIYDAASPATPPSSARGGYQPNAQSRPTYSPQGPMLRPRAYSVGREWGVQPDPIAMPDPSVLAYAPEVGAAILAQQEREKGGAPAFNPASPADLDMLERQQQDADRKALRDKTQAENRAKASK